MSHMHATGIPKYRKERIGVINIRKILIQNLQKVIKYREPFKKLSGFQAG